MKKLIVFDLDGTLIDSSEDISRAITYAAHTACNLPEGTITTAQVRPLLGKNLHDTFTLLLDPQYHSYIEDCVKAYREFYPSNSTVYTTIFPGLLEIIENLKERGCKLAVATTKYQTTVDAVVGRLNLAPYFDLIQGTNDFPHKPDPYILNLVMQKLEATPEQTIMIGDTDNDVLCAQRAGVEICAVTWGAWTAEQLTALHPNYIVNNPVELAQVLLNN